MSHISRIDLTRDFKAHKEAYMKAIEEVCEEAAFSGGRFADRFDEEFAPFVGTKYACGLIDIRSPFLLSHNYANLLSDDGIHPTIEGHRVIDELITEAVAEAVL